MTVKLRSGQRPGDLNGIALAYRLADEGGVAGLCVHPRHAAQRHKGAPNYALVRELVDELDIPIDRLGRPQQRGGRAARLR